MFNQSLPRIAGVALGVSMMIAGPASADALKDEIAPTGTLRGAIARLKNAQVRGYQTYDEICDLLKSGEVNAFALSRDQLNAMAKKIPGTRVLDETFKRTVAAVAVPLNHPLALAFATKFMTED